MSIGTRSRIDRNARRRRRAFTLLEVCLAVVIVGIVGLSIFRFLESNLLAIRLSTEQSEKGIAIEALIRVLQHQMTNLPLGEQNSFLGEAHRFSDVSSDEMSWHCAAGNGIFTANAAGEYNATLALKKVADGSDSELGIKRMPVDTKEQETNWLRLLPNVNALEIRYFDLRINAWVDKWTDPNVRPSLVRVRIWREKNPDPYEAILALPASNQALPK